VYLPKKIEKKKKLEEMSVYRAAKIAQYERENAEYEDYEVEVAFLGDSLTDGYDVKAYYPQYLTVNRGIGGDTTFDLEGRLQTSVYDLKPQVATLLIGANNFATMLDNYERILQGLKENLPNTKVVVLSLTAMGGDFWGAHNAIAAYNNVTIELLAKKYGYTFVDLFTPLYDVSIREVYAGYTTDGGHFTPKGYEVITAQIAPVLQKLLGH
jgi:lysophospholipase L1-like esterase